MASEIRVNKIENRSGLGTVTFADTGIDFAGIVTATTFSGSGASLTNLPAANLTGTLPAISGENLTGVGATDNVRTGILDVAGIATFRNDVNVGTAVTITESGINAVGVITATSFVGSGSGITGITTAASQILEQFYVPCNGYTVTTAHGTRTVETVSGVQNLTSSYADLTGSTITYRPPTGTTTVVYKFIFIIQLTIMMVLLTIDFISVVMRLHMQGSPYLTNFKEKLCINGQFKLAEVLIQMLAFLHLGIVI